MRSILFFIVGLCVVFTGCVEYGPVYKPDQTVYSRMTIAEARNFFKEDLVVRGGTALSIPRKEGRPCIVPFGDFAPYTFEVISLGDRYYASTRTPNPPCDIAEWSFQTKAEAQNFAAAIYVLSHASIDQLRIPDDPAEQSRFEEAAKLYRAQSVKPVLPEEAWKYKVQADAATSKKQYAEAIKLYRAALKVAPWWPEGHFNCALLMGNAQDYFGAVQEMKRYLLLVPNAPDARKAQDQIYLWEGQMR